jgi:hypothetical protein
MKPWLRRWVLAMMCVAVTPVVSLQAQQAPASFLGFPVGADFKLARWETITEYFRQVADASDRVLVEELGKSTDGNPLIMATIASDDVIRDIDRYKDIQRQLADPRLIPNGRQAELIRDSKTVVLITCNIHATEVGSAQMAMELLYELARGDSPEIREILDNVIILLAPSINPDGVNLVIDWYERTLGTPYEGSAPPFLYHPYADHDNNRDWFMLNLDETRLMTKVLYKEWFPAIVWDVHQQGMDRGRFVVPPYYEPLTPNMHPLINEMQKIIGGHMSTDLNAAGRKGINSYAQYDNWWNGGNRSTPNRHNIIGFLTEAASVRIASPVFLEFDELRGSRNFPDHSKAVTFADPWPGGWWRLRDIVDYELIAARSLLTLAARYRETFNRNYVQMGRDAIAEGGSDSPRAWIIPADQWDQPTAVKMLEIMQAGGVEVHRANAPVTADGVTYPAGSHIIKMVQPYRLFIRDLLDRQDYPDRRLFKNGPPDPPYDAAGWTLSLQMGVDAVPVVNAFDSDVNLLDSLVADGRVRDGSAGRGYAVLNRANNDRQLMNRYLSEPDRRVIVTQDAWSAGNTEMQPGAMIFQGLSGDAQDQFLQQARDLGCDLIPLSREPDVAKVALGQPRLGLYQPWDAVIDEGWTRLVLDQFEFSHTPVLDEEMRAGRLIDRYDVLMLASQSANSIRKGISETKIFTEYAGGLGDDGVANVREFVQNGGTLVTFGAASGFAIDELELPVKNVLAGLKQEEFFCPGSILGLDVDTVHPLGYGMPKLASAYFRSGMAFELTTDSAPANDFDEPEVGPAAEVIARYANRDVLQSGYLIGPEHIEGKAAVVVVHVGEGQVVLIGFRPQHRAQSHGTYKMIFNAIMYSLM